MDDRRMLRMYLLEEDPLNQEAFNMDDIEELADSITEKGFFGDIAAYPITGGMYRIESGHRRYRAAMAAGLKEIPVLITDPPKTMVERRLRLMQWNMHGRKSTPMDIAKLVAFSYQTGELKKQNGEYTGSLIEYTANDLGISTSNVSKYKSLLTLIPELQDLVRSGEVSWAIMAKAVVLSADVQMALYQHIILEQKLHPITGKWLETEIGEYKHIKLFSTNSYGQKYRQQMLEEAKKKKESQQALPAKEVNDDLPSALKMRHRRKDGIKALRNAYKYLRDACDEDVLLKGSDMPEAERLATEMSSMLRRFRDTLYMF